MTSTSLCVWNLPISWVPRSPQPMRPMLMRSLAPNTREYEIAVAAERPRRKFLRGTEMSDMPRLYNHVGWSPSSQMLRVRALGKSRQHGVAFVAQFLHQADAGRVVAVGRHAFHQREEF